MLIFQNKNTDPLQISDSTFPTQLVLKLQNGKWKMYLARGMYQ